MKTSKRNDSSKSLSQTGGHRVVAGTKSTARKTQTAPEAARAMVDALEAILRAERASARA